MGNICTAICSSKDANNEDENIKYHPNNSDFDPKEPKNSIKGKIKNREIPDKKQHKKDWRPPKSPHPSKSSSKHSPDGQKSPEKRIQDHETGSIHKNQKTPKKPINISTGNSPSTRTKPKTLSSSKKLKKMKYSDFYFLRYLGKGSFGKVALVRKKDTGSYYGIKILKKSDFKGKNSVKNAYTEKEVLMKSRHPFVVKLRYSFQDKLCLYFVMDYVPGGDLSDHLKKFTKFSVKQAKFYASEVLSALEHLHNDLNTTYRDLKPENVLIDQTGHIKLTDFGISKIGSDGVSYSFCGTPNYLAPEIILSQGHTKMVDFWSFGCLIYEMLVGSPPFQAQNTNILFARICSQSYLLPEDLDPTAVSLIKGLLCGNQKRRLGSRGIKEVKQHPFFAGIDFRMLEKLELEPPIRPVIRADEGSQEAFIYKPTPGPGSQPTIKGISYTGESLAALRMESPIMG